MISLFTTEETALSALPASLSAEGEKEETVIRPGSGWQFINFRELWKFRDLLYFLIWRDVKIRYKQTVLGAAWAILQPALMMIVFTIFFGNLAKVPSGPFPYPIFVYSGLLLWSFFATGLANGGQSVVGSERLITKIYFPRLAIPLASVGAALVDFVVALTVFFGLIMFYGIGLTWNLFLVVPVFVGVFLATSGMAIFLGALNVIYRDVRYVIPFLVQVWMFATPTIYMDPSGFEALEKTGWNWLLWANPMTGLVACFRAATLGGSIPWLMFFSGLVISVVLFIAGCLYFRKLEDQFADVI